MKIFLVNSNTYECVYQHHLLVTEDEDWCVRLKMGDIIIFLGVTLNYGSTKTIAKDSMVLYKGRIGWIEDGEEFFENHCIEID